MRVEEGCWYTQYRRDTDRAGWWHREAVPEEESLGWGEERLFESRIEFWNFCTKMIFLASPKRYWVLWLPAT